MSGLLNFVAKGALSALIQDSVKPINWDIAKAEAIRAVEACEAAFDQDGFEGNQDALISDLKSVTEKYDTMRELLDSVVEDQNEACEPTIWNFFRGSLGEEQFEGTLKEANFLEEANVQVWEFYYDTLPSGEMICKVTLTHPTKRDPDQDYGTEICVTTRGQVEHTWWRGGQLTPAYFMKKFQSRAYTYRIMQSVQRQREVGKKLCEGVVGAEEDLVVSMERFRQKLHEKRRQRFTENLLKKLDEKLPGDVREMLRKKREQEREQEGEQGRKRISQKLAEKLRGASSSARSHTACPMSPTGSNVLETGIWQPVATEAMKAVEACEAAFKQDTFERNQGTLFTGVDNVTKKYDTILKDLDSVQKEEFTARDLEAAAAMNDRDPVVWQEVVAHSWLGEEKFEGTFKEAEFLRKPNVLVWKFYFDLPRGDEMICKVTLTLRTSHHPAFGTEICVTTDGRVQSLWWEGGFAATPPCRELRPAYFMEKYKRSIAYRTKNSLLRQRKLLSAGRKLREDGREEGREIVLLAEKKLLISMDRFGERLREKFREKFPANLLEKLDEKLPDELSEKLRKRISENHDETPRKKLRVQNSTASCSASSHTASRKASRRRLTPRKLRQAVANKAKEKRKKNVSCRRRMQRTASNVKSN